MRWSNLTLGEDEQRRLPGYRDEAVVRRFQAPEALDTRFYEVRAKSMLNRVPEKSRGESPVAVSATATGLSSHTIYHFRVVATNPGGTSFSAEKTFETK